MVALIEKPWPFKGKLGARGTDVSVSLRMLVLIRWIAVLGQAATLLLVHYLFDFELPLRAPLGVVAISAALNLFASRPRRAGARLGGRDAALYLAFDTLQLGVLLFLTGGLQNPFAILMLAPVTVAATVLSRPTVIGLSVLTIAAISVLALLHLPLPTREGIELGPAPLYVLAIWTALVSSTIFITGYNWSIAEGARRMRDAFAATQLALAREQRVSAVGSLAAAAAHQLGSPLTTISLVAKELARELPKDSPFAEDAVLLLSQSERCRTILADLARSREGGDGFPFARLPFSALVEAAGEPHGRPEIRVIHATGSSRDGAGNAIEQPLVQRSPEILHGLGNLIENAIQFAEREVTVTASWSAEVAAVDIVDDGPGFAATVLARLGEPYISARIGADGHAHMGLGVFIAQSLLERTGAHVSFTNDDGGGAHVVVEWPRVQIDGEGRAASAALAEAGM